MDPSEVRATVLGEHRKLRAQLAALIVLAKEVRSDLTRGQELLDGCNALRESLRSVQDLEEKLLVPALSEADAWGDVRIERLFQLQKMQCDAVKSTLSLLTHDELPVLVRASAVIALGEEVERELTTEDRELLSPEVLRDDVITIGGNAG